MTEEDLKQDSFFTADGKSIWKLISWCPVPSCTLQNVETKEQQDFGLGGLTAQAFKKIEMPKTK